MFVDEIAKIVEGSILCRGKEHDLESAFSSDLMSDVLALCSEKVLLITGLANLQAIRTAEMAEIDHILFVRGKKVTEGMRKVAEENQMTLIETRCSMFKVSGELYKAGIKPCF